MLFPPLLKGLRKMCVLEASDLPDASSMSLRIKDSEKARNNLGTALKTLVLITLQGKE